MTSRAPWTDEEVERLNASQNDPMRHPFTCDGPRDDFRHRDYRASHGGDLGQLVATRNGWICPVCGYKQGWAHDFMVKK